MRTIASPCRTIQYAHDNTNAGGEIDVLDSAGYGAVTITKGISIVGDGVIAGLLAGAGADAITVSAGANDTVVLRGLVNTTSSNNSATGISLQGAGAASRMTVVLDHVVASKNGQFGIGVFVFPGASTTVAASVSDSLLSLNGFSGLGMTGNATVNVDHSRAEGNVQDGFGISSWNNAASPSGLLVIGRSVSSANGRGGLVNSGGTIQSYGDNRIVGSALPTVGTIGTIAAQ